MTQEASGPSVQPSSRPPVTDMESAAAGGGGLGLTETCDVITGLRRPACSQERKQIQDKLDDEQ